MDGTLFERLSKALSDVAHRRTTFKALAGTGLASLGAPLVFDEAGAKKKKKRRCRKRRQSCGGKKKCCGGDTACREFPTLSCTTLTGKRCCGLEGAVCDNTPGINNCDCCDGLFCGGVEGPGRCQEEPT